METLGRDQILGRFDLDVTSDMICGRSWTLSSLDGYIRYMSFLHDWGRFPRAEVVDLILRHSTNGSVPSAAIEALREIDVVTEPETLAYGPAA